VAEDDPGAERSMKEGHRRWGGGGEAVFRVRASTIPTTRRNCATSSTPEPAARTTTRRFPSSCTGRRDRRAFVAQRAHARTLAGRSVRQSDAIRDDDSYLFVQEGSRGGRHVEEGSRRVQTAGYAHHRSADPVRLSSTASLPRRAGYRARATLGGARRHAEQVTEGGVILVGLEGGPAEAQRFTNSEHSCFANEETGIAPGDG